MKEIEEKKREEEKMRKIEEWAAKQEELLQARWDDDRPSEWLTKELLSLEECPLPPGYVLIEDEKGTKGDDYATYSHWIIRYSDDQLVGFIYTFYDEVSVTVRLVKLPLDA